MKKIVGKNLKIYRNKKGYTQERLAELTGLQTQMIRNIESGINFVSSESLEKLCLALSVSPNILMSPYEVKCDAEDVNIKQDIINNLNGCNTKKLKMIHEFVHMLVNYTESES